MSDILNRLQRFIESSPSVFHSANNIADTLDSLGFKLLDEASSWDLQVNSRYYIKRFDTSVIAWQQGDNLAQNGFKILASHCDSPIFKIKINSQHITSGIKRCAVEVYGSPILNTWLDRPLSLAGQVMLKQGTQWIARNCVTKPVATIANLAIHLNRDVNKGFEYNKHNHLQALFGLSTQDTENDFIQKFLADYFKVSVSDIGAMDLYLIPSNSTEVLGLDGDILQAARIDNLSMCQAILESLAHLSVQNSTVVGLFLDHEEIGSNSAVGADGSFVSTVLNRICNFEKDCDVYERALANSFMLSVDGAHALHPNFADKHDNYYAPKLGQGVVIKQSANHRYISCARTVQTFIDICQKVGVQYQEMINRADIPSGSTIGPLTSAQLGVKGVDIGIAMLAMHSINETCSIADYQDMVKVLIGFCN